MYLLSIISSVAGIISFALAYADKFNKWKSHLFAFACFMFGIATGVFIALTDGAIQHFTQPQIIYLVALVLVVGFGVLFVHRYMKHNNDPAIIAFFVLMGLSYVGMQILNSVEISQSLLRPGDYLILSQHFKETQDFSRAADCLRKYKELDSDHLTSAMKDSIDVNIKSLTRKGFGQIK